MGPRRLTSPRRAQRPRPPPLLRRRGSPHRTLTLALHARWRARAGWPAAAGGAAAQHAPGAPRTPTLRRPRGPPGPTLSPRWRPLCRGGRGERRGRAAAAAPAPRSGPRRGRRSASSARRPTSWPTPRAPTCSRPRPRCPSWRARRRPAPPGPRRRPRPTPAPTRGPCGRPRTHRRSRGRTARLRPAAAAAGAALGPARPVQSVRRPPSATPGGRRTQPAARCRPGSLTQAHLSGAARRPPGARGACAGWRGLAQRPFCPGVYALALMLTRRTAGLHPGHVS